MNPKRSICLLRRELKILVMHQHDLSVSILMDFTFTTRFLGRVDVVHLGNLLVGVLPCTVSKVNINIDTTGVV